MVQKRCFAEALVAEELTFNIIGETGIVAILRASSSDHLLHACDALLAGGIRAVEVTLTTPSALATITAARKNFRKELYFGAGSVLSPNAAQSAIDAGAQFIVAPSLNFTVITHCLDRNIPIMPGAFTPTEIVNAWEAGATMVKVFPANLGGPELIKALKAPLPQIAMAAVGGVETENAAAFIRSGASALGVGSSLVNDRLLVSGNFGEIQRRAARFIEEVRLGRGG